MHDDDPRVASNLRLTDEEWLIGDTVAALAEETRLPPAAIKEVFEEQYARLKATARVPDYLVLFAIRRTRDALAERFPAIPTALTMRENDTL
jgi:hypothetical protein